jgi:hypothetical protein
MDSYMSVYTHLERKRADKVMALRHGDVSGSGVAAPPFLISAPDGDE